MTIPATTIDGLLNRRVTLEQPAKGYRVAIDTVLLAASVPARAGEFILDIGCGVGGASLCVACRVPGLNGLGIDIQAGLVTLFRRNIAANKFATGFEAQEADITQSRPSGLFDHVLMNPPFHEEARHDVSPDPVKQTANSQMATDLGLWIIAGMAALKKGGTLSLIHRSSRLEEILEHLRKDFGAAEILPLLPRRGEGPKRLIIRAQKGGVFAPRPCLPLVLHKEEGGYTEAADAILRECQPLVFQSP
ncbi:MAG: methyltransferase [Alphaproteobacteria bacterium]|nr:methyltransferase [Alphaproteobacteria bacterium]